MKWKQIKKTKRGHRFFKKVPTKDGEEADNRIYIADESGRVPSTTDDGELHIDVKRLEKMFPLKIDSGVQREWTLPLRDKNGDKASTFVTLEGLIEAADLVLTEQVLGDLHGEIDLDFSIEIGGILFVAE